MILKEKKRLWDKRYRDRHPDRVQKSKLQYRKKNREKCYRASNEWRKRHPGYLGPKRQALVDWTIRLRKRPCKDCGGKFHFSAMDFDHRPGTKKRGEVMMMVSQTRPKAEIRAEIKKCDIVCSNCHRVRTWKRNQP